MRDKPVAIITGASQGIGAATAKKFAAAEYNIVINAMPDDSGLAEVERDAMAAGAQVMAIPGDLVDLEFAKSIIDRSKERFGRIDALVNNAAWREVQTMREAHVESWEKTLRVCLTVPAFLSKWAAEVMEPQKTGVIINISSIRAERPDGICAAYHAAKAGMDNLTRDLACLYGQSNIRVITVRPGAIDTAMSRDLSDLVDRDGVYRKCLDEIPMNRMGTPDDVAGVIIWLAGDDAAYVSGTTIDVDGGMLANGRIHSFKKTMKPDQFQ